ncbi:hypothetical protein C0W59_22085 [Photobacterium kishitanii]|uniref:hypothetical protein n=1 Tax=Photobacterium kishitanii TaxID=318456 RepID=UPI000D15BC70|nr:hypothetical protein [Photobacterium kishitanii]PSV09566.1 hypothetical protein C0W59_22085 [Photobacterium kishitanii]
MMIKQWFHSYSKDEKSKILKDKILKTRIKLIQAINNNNREKMNELLAIYEELVIEFENL